MSDPLLAAQRLPVYIENFNTQKKKPPLNTLADYRDECVSCAITQDSLNTPCKTRNVKTECKEPKLPSFHFPPGKGVVLIIDDTNVNRKIIGRMLKFYNLESVEAVNGKEAVDIIRTSHNVTGDSNAPHVWLILMDRQIASHGRIRGHGYFAR
jgi:hypothetical protein